MENQRLKLPIGIQTFEKLRDENCVYVDKTKYLIDLIKNGSVYFLARPRRFGKSLIVTTLDAIFSGKKELFKGLDAEEFLNSHKFEPSPVIRLDISKTTTDKGLENIELSLQLNTLKIAKKLNVDIRENIPAGLMLGQLIENTAIKYNSRVVVLIDEYDKPYTDFMNDPKMANDIREILRGYYIQLKANDEYIKFLFMTGISKFTKLGVFSTLNNLDDISMATEYANICGYTEKEIRDNFPDYLAETADNMQITVEELIAKMQYYYNGFCFDKDAKNTLYNPFSTLKFFKEKTFANFWMSSGTPKFIADYLKARNLTVEQFRNLPVSDDFVRNPGDMDSTPPEGFLFQSGYLTLRPGITNQLSLDYPNTEVLNSMSNLLIYNLLNEDTNNLQNDLFSALMYGETEELVKTFNLLLASIPYDDFSKAAIQSIKNNRYKYSATEWLYRSSIFSFLRGAGINVIAEMHVNMGRPDLVIFHKDKTYVIEIKVAYKGQNVKNKAKEAMKQIIENNYAKPFPDAICIGLAIDDEQRQIAEYCM